MARKILFAVLLLMVGAAPGGAARDGAGPASWQNDLTPIGAGDRDHQKAAHLLERAGFGATPAEVEHLAGTPPAAVDWLVDYQQHADTLEPVRCLAHLGSGDARRLPEQRRERSTPATSSGSCEYTFSGGSAR